MSFGGGKVILLGEHGVVYGRPALAVGLERGAHAKASIHATNVLDIATWNLRVEPDPQGELLARAFAEALSRSTPDAPVRVQVDVELPAGAGLGCSAAVGVAVIAALDELRGVERSRVDLGHEAIHWERVFHGNPSGIDNMIAACGGAACYRKSEGLDRITFDRSFWLVVGDSGEASSTKERVAEVARFHERDRAGAERIFDAMASLAQNGRLAIEAADHPRLGRLMDLNHALLNALMLSTPRLEELVAAAREAGALGAKVTGAGGGGCMVALCAEEQRAGAVRASLEGLGASSFITEVRS